MTNRREIPIENVKISRRSFVVLLSFRCFSEDTTLDFFLLLLIKLLILFQVFFVLFKSGSQRGAPWSPGALKFLLWSPEPDHFTDWSPDTFLAVEPGAQRNFVRSPEPSVFKIDHSSSHIAIDRFHVTSSLSKI